MKEIDFLPRQYHDQNASRKAHVWRIGVFLLFSSAIATASLIQYALASSTSRRLEKVAATYAEALARQSHFSQAQQNLAAEEATAGLYAFLEHPWPRTRILAEIIAPLPHEVTLLDIQLSSEPIRDANSNLQRFAREEGRENENASPASPARDFEKLLNEANTTQSVVEVAGITADATALHRFVDALGKSRLFASAELSTFESATRESFSEFMQFELRLVVRPAYGVAGGPHEKLLADAVAGKSATRESP